jgi:hypothetical protein
MSNGSATSGTERSNPRTWETPVLTRFDASGSTKSGRPDGSYPDAGLYNAYYPGFSGYSEAK